MKKYFQDRTSVNVFLLFCVMMFVSCYDIPGYDFVVRNNCSDTVFIHTFPMRGYYLGNNMPVDGKYEKTLFEVPPYSQIFFSYATDDGLNPKGLDEDDVTPIWKYIEYVTLGEDTLPPSLWQDEANWKMESFAHGAGIRYTLNISVETISGVPSLTQGVCFFSRRVAEGAEVSQRMVVCRIPKTW